MGHRVGYNKFRKDKEVTKMTNEYTVRSAIEILIAILLVVGVIYEGRIAEWEAKIAKKIRRRFFRKDNVIPFDPKRSPRDESRAI